MVVARSSLVVVIVQRSPLRFAATVAYGSAAVAVTVAEPGRAMIADLAHAAVDRAA